MEELVLRHVFSSDQTCLSKQPGGIRFPGHIWRILSCDNAVATWRLRDAGGTNWTTYHASGSR